MDDPVSSPKSTYGLLLVGGAHTHQENYAPAFAADPRCELIGLTDETNVSKRRRELNQQLARELNIPLLPDLRESLNRQDVDIVVVCVEPERRARLALMVAEAGKHLYVDKPVCTTAAEAKQLVQEVKHRQTLNQCFSLVEMPLSRQALKAVQTFEMGELIGLHCELLFAKGIPGSADLNVSRQEFYPAEDFTFIDSKRELFCVGWYPLVLFELLAGAPVKKVYAGTSNYFFQEHQQNNVEDFAMLQLEYTNGVQATCTVGRTGWSSHRDYGIHQLDLVGTKKTVSLDAFKPRLEIYSDASPWQQPKSGPPEDPMGFWSSTVAEARIEKKTDWFVLNQAASDDARAFLDALDRHESGVVTVELGARVIQVIQAAYESAALKKPVLIEPL